jgi:hypothetical protein
LRLVACEGRQGAAPDGTVDGPTALNAPPERPGGLGPPGDGSTSCAKTVPGTVR